MSRIVLNRGSLGGSHSYAVTTLLLALAEKLSLDVSRFERRIDREALGRLMLQIGARPENEIRHAAELCYAELFGAPRAQRRRTARERARQVAPLTGCVQLASQRTAAGQKQLRLSQSWPL